MKAVDDTQTQLLSHIMVPLSDLAEINPPRSSVEVGPEDMVSFIPMGDTTESGRWVNRQSRKYSEVRQGFTFFEEGDVLFAKITPCMENGKGCIAIGLDKAVGFGSTEFHVLRAREGADAGFIYQWSTYQELRRQARNTMTGSAGQQRVPKEFFNQFLVPQLAKPEQAKIAEILSTVDRAIEQTEALIAKQQRIKTGLMQDLLTRGIDEHGNLRTEKTHKFKDSPLGRIPVEWAVKTLNDCYTEPARNGLYKPKEFYGAGNSMIHMPQMFRGLTVDVASAVRVQVDRSEMDRFGLQTNDLLIARRSLVLEGAGRCALVPEVTEPTTFESSIIRVRLRQNQLNATFANFFLNSDAGYRMRLPFIRQVAVSGVSGEDVGKFYIPVPEVDEQSRILDCFCKSEVLICGMVATANKIKRQKTALMQDLLTGNKRISVLLNDTEIEDFDQKQSD